MTDNNHWKCPACGIVKSAGKAVSHLEWHAMAHEALLQQLREPSCKERHRFIRGAAIAMFGQHCADGEGLQTVAGMSAIWKRAAKLWAAKPDDC